MPRKYIPKTDRNQINEDAVKNAVISVFKCTLSERQAAASFNIKRSTLKSRIKKILQKYTKDEYIRKNSTNVDDSGNESEPDDESPKYSSKYTVRQVFTNEQELMLVKYIKKII